MAVNYRQIKAIEKKNKERILGHCPDVPECSGIYVLTREENGFGYAYIGQAKHLLTRLAQHLSGYQHIDLSLKKRGLWSESNQSGWKITWGAFLESELDVAERYFIKNYADRGYQLYNHTSGGQGEGKKGIGEGKSPKGYHDGLKQGYLNARKEIAKLFDKHLNYSKKSNKPNKNQEKAFEKFRNFLEWENNDG